MTKPTSFSKAGLRRAIETARASGLRVTAILPDGTLLIAESNDVVSAIPSTITIVPGQMPSGIPAFWDPEF
jgi:hypothetical protein